MIKLPLKSIGMTSLFAIGVAISPAYAQDNNEASASNGGLEEIVVTARKKSENMQEVAISVSAVTQSEIERSFSTDIRDLAGISPSIIIDDTSQGPGGLASIYIRGIGVSDVEKNFDPAVGVVVDGVFLGQNAGSIARALDLESMEVLRGPQGTVFGRNTIGGVLKLQRTKPTGEFGGKVRASYGNYERSTLDALLNFGVSDKIAVKLTGTYSKQGEGFFYNSTLDRDQGRSEYTNLGFNLLFSPTEDIELEYTHNRERTDQDQPPILNVGREGDLFCDAFAYCTTGNELPISGDRYVTVMNDEIPGLLDATFDADTHIVELRWDVSEDLHFDYIFGNWATEEVTTGDWDATPETLFHTYRPAEYDQKSHEARLTFDNDGRFSAVAGVYLWDSEYEIRLRSLIGFAVPNLILDIPQTTKQTTDSSAFFFEGDYEFSDKLKLTVGGRYGHDKKTTDQSASLVAQAEASWNKFTPKVALTYKISDDTMVFGTFSQGYRSGGFNGRVDSDFAATTPYNPETVDNFELGFKADMLDNTLRLNATVYHMKYKDKQEEVQIPSTGGTGQATVVTNASTATIQGIEFDAMLVPTEGLTIRANLGYLDASYDEFVFQGPSGPVDYSHLNFRRAPKITSNVSFNYDWEVGEGMATVGAGWHMMGAYNTDFFNKPYLRNPSAQHMINANIGYSIGNAQINIYGRNLAKEDGYTIGFQVANLWAYAAPRNPRTYGVEVNYKF